MTNEADKEPEQLSPFKKFGRIALLCAIASLLGLAGAGIYVAVTVHR